MLSIIFIALCSDLHSVLSLFLPAKTILAGESTSTVYSKLVHHCIICVFEIGHFNSRYSVAFIKSYLLSLWFWSEKLLKLQNLESFIKNNSNPYWIVIVSLET